MKKLLASLCVLLSFSLLPVANAQLRYFEGKDYSVLKKPLPLRKEGQAEVVEFFAYTCPHCYNLEPVLLRWVAEKKPKNVGFYQVHATGGMWTFPAHVQQVALKLGLSHDFDKQYFDAIHKKRNRRLAGDKKTAIDFIAKTANIEKAKVEKAWNSLQVKVALKRANNTFMQSGLQGVPAVVVNGQYLVQLTDYERFFSVIEFLLATKKVPPAPSNKTEHNTTKTNTKSATEKPATENKQVTN